MHLAMSASRARQRASACAARGGMRAAMTRPQETGRTRQGVHKRSAVTDTHERRVPSLIGARGVSDEAMTAKSARRRDTGA